MAEVEELCSHMCDSECGPPAAGEWFLIGTRVPYEEYVTIFSRARAAGAKTLAEYLRMVLGVA